jgi:hypothetical protein
MTRTSRNLFRANLFGANLFGVLATCAAVALAIGATSSTPAHAATCQLTTKALGKQNAAAERQTKRLLASTSYTPVIRNFTLKPTSTRGFTGFETIVVKSPKGTTPVVGYFTQRGGEPCSVVITSAAVALARNAYVVKLKFPGEQGNPGRLKVTLISR